MFRTACIFCFLLNLHMTLSRTSIRHVPEPPLPPNCAEAVVVQSPFISVYSIRVPNSTHPPFNVYCDRSEQHRPWTVIYRKQHGEVIFSNRTGFEYQHGFGNIRRDFFIGHKKIEALTSMERHEMQVSVLYHDDTIRTVRYNDLRVTLNDDDFEVESLGDEIHDEMSKLETKLFQPEWMGFLDDKLGFQIMIRPLVEPSAAAKNEKPSTKRKTIEMGDYLDKDSDEHSNESASYSEPQGLEKMFGNFL